MAKSMTAFARTVRDGDWGNVQWEIRSVNNRYLDVSLRLPDELRALEPDVRERVREHLGRGKVDAQLKVQHAAGHAGGFAIDTELAERVAGAARDLAPLLGPAATGDAMDVLRWPGVIQSPPVDVDTLAAAALEALDTALGELVDTRRREGEKIEAMVRERLDAIGGLVTEVRELGPEVLSQTRARLVERLSEVREQLDEDRLEQEMVLLAQKQDVAEELDRLEAHVKEVSRVLGRSEPIGRRLDFLMQELNREANTLGSKSADAAVTRASVDLKVYIEQMREQIQNVE